MPALAVSELGAKQTHIKVFFSSDYRPAARRARRPKGGGGEPGRQIEGIEFILQWFAKNRSIGAASIVFPSVLLYA